MKLFIRFTKKRRIVRIIGSLAIIISQALFIGTSIEVAAISNDQLNIFSQNNILFYDPTCNSLSSSVCGKTAKEKYWSAFRRHFDEVHAAAIMGNIMNEGSFSPVLWEYGKVIRGNGGPFLRSWESLYNCQPCGVGVGSVGITWNLGNYLHYINDEAPDLLKYFSDASYSYPGEEALEKIGEQDFNRLVEIEVAFIMKDSAEMHDGFKAITNIADAAQYWAQKYERCDQCGQPGSSGSAQVPLRRASAEKAYDEFKGFSCGVSSFSGISGNDITLIGDSIAVQSEAELQEKFPNSFLTKVGSRHPTSKGVCNNDSGGLSILQTIVSGSGSVVNQHSSGVCDSEEVDASSLKANIVWELGTNEAGATRQTIENVINIIGNRKLFLVTPYNGLSMSTADSIAEMYRDVTKEYDNVYIVDWNEAVRDKESEYVTRADGMAVHPTERGRKLMANLIAEAVNGTGLNNVCSGGRVEGGLTEAQAQKLAAYYNGPEVNAALWGLPFGKTNCVSFSMWFTGYFTGLSWASGNGRDVAHNFAISHNLSEGTEPQPFSVFSVTHGVAMCGTALCGHTGIVVAVDGDQVITVEAGYPSTPAHVAYRNLDYFRNTVYKNTFTYVSSKIDQSKLIKVVGN